MNSGDNGDELPHAPDYSEEQKKTMNAIANKFKNLNVKTIFNKQPPLYNETEIASQDTITNDNIEKIRNLREKLNKFGSLEPTKLKNEGYSDDNIAYINSINNELNRLSALETLKMNEDLGNKLANTTDVATGGKPTKPTKPIKPTKPTITGKKEILGKQRCIYKKAGDRKEYVKYKGDLITVKDYKKIISVKKTKK